MPKKLGNLSLKDICEKYNLNYNTFYYYLKRKDLSLEEAIERTQEAALNRKNEKTLEDFSEKFHKKPRRYGKSIEEITKSN